MKKFIVLLLGLSLICALNVKSQNYFVSASSGIYPMDTLKKKDFSNSLGFGYAYKNFVLSANVMSSYDFKSCYFGLYPMVTVFETTWTTVYAYCGLGTNVKDVKQMYIEYGGGMYIPMGKDFLLSPYISFANFNQSPATVSLNLTLIYNIPKKKKDEKK